jgi:hypothetical protein
MEVAVRKHEREAVEVARKLGVEDVRLGRMSDHALVVGRVEGETFKFKISRGTKGAWDVNWVRAGMRSEIRHLRREVNRRAA